MFKELKDTYLGNKKLKRSGVKQQFTSEQVQELVRCSNDPLYFINHYVKIVNLDLGLIQMTAYPYQREMINLIHENRFVIAMVARQSGKTIAYAAYIVWYILFNEAKFVVILGNKGKTAKDILARVKRAYEELPMWMQQGVLEWNKTSIELENGSKVAVDATGGSTGRSGSINLLVLDEFAFVPRNVASEFMKAVYPTITSGTTTKILIVSTPNGMNLFYKMYTEATKKINSYIPFTMHWSDVPGRDKKWYEETVKNMGKAEFDQEYGCEFQGSGVSTLIPSFDLKNMVFDQPLYSREFLDVYMEPDKTKEYVIVVDVSRGEENDHSAFTIFNISSMPYKIAAKYRNNKISPMEFPAVIVAEAKKYNEAMLLIELNDTGGEVADIIKNDYEYDNLFTTQQDKKVGQPKLSIEFGKKFKLGVVTSRTVKNVGCANLKAMVEQTQIIINDFDMISELSTFSAKGASFAAEKGASDDLAMNLVLFAWLTGQKFFKEISKNSIRNVLKEKADAECVKPILGDPEENQMDVLEKGDLVVVEETVQTADQWMSEEYVSRTNNYLRFRN